MPNGPSENHRPQILGPLDSSTHSSTLGSSCSKPTGQPTRRRVKVKISRSQIPLLESAGQSWLALSTTKSGGEEACKQEKATLWQVPQPRFGRRPIMQASGWGQASKVPDAAGCGPARPSAVGSAVDRMLRASSSLHREQRAKSRDQKGPTDGTNSMRSPKSNTFNKDCRI